MHTNTDGGGSRDIDRARGTPLRVFTPQQVARMYRFPTDKTGAGCSIGIIELGGGFRPSDLTTYFTDPRVNSRVPKVRVVEVNGARNNPADTASSVEVLLDMEVAGAIAPDATLVMYFAPNTIQGFVAAVNRAVADRVNVISISWGAPEVLWGTAGLHSMNSACAAAVAAGITVFVASGDRGSSDGLSGRNVDFPAASPNVVACGGTKLLSVDGVTIDSEVAWSYGGGGFSTKFSRPVHQSGVVPTNTKGRAVPDVSAVADPNTGFLVYANGRFMTVGGTSAVAPLLAGLTALLKQGTVTPPPLPKSLPFLAPTLYREASRVCVDVTSGSNGDFVAGTGWDAPSGLGRIDGQQAVSAFA
jgi:kumamolisin